MKRRHVVALAVLVMSGMLSPVQAAGESAAQEMLKGLPRDTFFCVATSGGDAVGLAFKESSLGRIWYDPGVRQFAEQTKAALLEALAKHAGEDMPPAADIEKLVCLIASCPIVAGAAPAAGPADAADTADSLDKGGLSGFVFIKAGDKKDAIAALITQFESLAPEGEIVTRQIARTEMHAPKAQEDMPLCWGWQGDVFVVLINDERGAGLRSLRRSESRAAAVPVIPETLPCNGDLLLLWCDLEKGLGLLEQAIAAEDAGDAAAMKNVLDKLGLGSLRTVAARAGFQGRNLVVDEVIALSQPPAGLLAAARPIDMACFDRVESGAVNAVAWNIDVPSIYDTIMGVIESQSPKSVEEVNEQIGALEQATGINIRGGLIKNIAGPMVLYKLPPFQIPQAPNGGWGLMAEVSDPGLLKSSLDALGAFAASKAEGMLQMGSQKTADGDTINTWVIAPLAMMQVMPAWTIKDKTLIVGTQPVVVERALRQLKSADARASSVRSRDDFRAMEAKLPQQVLALNYEDSQAQLRSLRQQLQQYWPMLTMMLSPKGVRLPVMLPDIEEAIAGMPASWEYWWREGNDIRVHYEGCGVQSPSVSVPAVAMGAAIVMPALSKTKKTAQRVVGATNLKQIGLACHVYAEHDGKFPPTLETLCETGGLSPKSLESPRKPEGFKGPSFIYIAGQAATVSPSQNILAYENPDFAGKQINVLYLDGHVEAVSPEKLEEQLAATRKTLEPRASPSVSPAP
jgi:prepilin-type processing-associated H-X9-DG protein